MDIDILSKLTLGVVSAIGTIALAFLSIGRTRRLQADLVEKFEEALVRESLHSVTELFRLIHGLRMSYTDIVELVKHNQCSKIIYILKRTPGMVSYQDGEIQYSNIARNSIFRFFDRWFLRLSIVFFSLSGLASLMLLGLSQGVMAGVGFVFLLPSSFMLALQVRELKYDQMVKNLINSESIK
ncbi:MAG: hypothetical protein WEA82_06705 [Idiomarina sp.]